MIDLAQRSEPYEIALPYGLSVTVKPLTTAGMAAAQAAARRAVEAIERQARERTEAGLELDGLPDLSAEGERDGFYQAQLIRELAVRHVTSWTGVELEGGPAPPTPENIAAVMELYPGRRAVLPGVHAPAGAAERRKKRVRALCRWHFQPGGGPEYCRACRDDGLPCARGEPGADGRLCPYREHALISRQEHEAWEVLLACQGQLRLAPSGHVIGIDMDAALEARRRPRLRPRGALGAACPRPRRAWSRRCVPARVGHLDLSLGAYSRFSLPRQTRRRDLCRLKSRGQQQLGCSLALCLAPSTRHRAHQAIRFRDCERATQLRPCQ